MKRAEDAKRKGRWLIAAGLLCIALAAAIGIAALVMDGAAGHPDPDPEGAVGQDAECPVDWEHWKSVNPDVVGWARVEGTAIDQPIVQAHADDPTYYLTHDVYRNFNLWGCPYVDAACEAGIDSYDVVVFGHNMSFPPAMFHDFEGYHDREFAEGHRDVTVYTPESTRHLQVVAAETVNGWEEAKRTVFSGASDYWEFMSGRIGGCPMRLEESPAFAKAFTFCTCSYFQNPSDERTLVYALEAPKAAR